MVLIASLAAGSAVVCAPRLEPRRFFQWLEAFRPTWFSAVPTMHHAILTEAGAHGDVVARASLRFVRSCSAALPARLKDELERVFRAPVVDAYGMTEATHQISSNPLPPEIRKAGSVGRPAGVELAIADATGRLLSPGDRGEVVIRGPSVTEGYVDDAAANEAAFRDGWLRTGDEGYLDTDGYLFLTGRLKEIINRGGSKISPAEIDEVLMSHPNVARAVTFAVPHPTLGENVAAAIVVRPGAVVTEDEIRALVAERLASFKMPQRIVFPQELPTGRSGKLQRRGLAAILGLTAPGDGAPVGATTARTEIEIALAAIWARVLEVDKVGLDQDFFSLGGDSLSAVRLFSEIERSFGRLVSPSVLIQAPTVAALAPLIDSDGPVSTGGPSFPCRRGARGRLSTACTSTRDRSSAIGTSPDISATSGRSTGWSLGGWTAVNLRGCGSKTWLRTT